MKRTTDFVASILAAVFSAVVLTAVSSCTRESLQAGTAEEVTITATATLPGESTKMIYEDHSTEGMGVKAGWQTGDSFLALEINGGTVTPVTFTATASKDIKATFTSSGAVAADAGTRWVAVLGKGAAFRDGLVTCSYSGQNGTLKGLEGYDYMVAQATGETPEFNYAEGKHLTYLMRLTVPAGVGRLEFNTCEGAEWTVDSNGKVTAGVPDYRPKAVKTVSLASETKAAQVVYLAVPAVDYSSAGLIVTAMSKDGKHSQGKVTSDDFSGKGGVTGKFDLGAELMDRPAVEDAIDFVSPVKSRLMYINNSSFTGINDIYDFENCPKWAPFNVGAKASPASAEEAYGNLYAWGETETRGTYSRSSYRYADVPGGVGVDKQYHGDADNYMTFKVISGTKHDVARVKWGKDWRMPRLEEAMYFTGANEVVTLTPDRVTTLDTGMKTEDVTEYYGIEVNGRKFTRNGRTLFLPYSGRYYYTDGGETSKTSMVGKYGYYLCGTHCNSAGSIDAHRFHVRANNIDCLAQEAGYAFSVRAVLAQETDYDPLPVSVSGRVTDASTGRGISGVTVSDGFNCWKTDASGNYSFEADIRARTIQVTVPAAYEIPLGSDGRPAFYKEVNLKSSNGETVDFQLTPRTTTGTRFTVIALSDAHVMTKANLSRFSKESIPDIQNTITELEASGEAGTIIGIGLGDQLWDNMSMASDVRSQYTSLHTSKGTMPFFYCIGNHDHQSEIGKTDEESTAVFVKNFSPTDYSFDIGNAHVIVMDNIWYTGSDSSGSYGTSKINYKEKITGDQLHWLRADIDNVSDKENKVVIFCTHAPIYQSIGNGEALKNLINRFHEAHILSGHIHNLSNHYHRGMKARGGRTLLEHNLQSLCGTWWDGDLSSNGTPNGYGVFTFEGKNLVAEYNKVTKENKNFQMRVYNGNDVYNGHTANSGVSSPKKNTEFSWGSDYRGKFVVRLWDGDDPDADESECTWQMTFVKNGVSTPMTRLSTTIVDKCAAAFTVDILGSPYGTNGTSESYSWWVIDAPGGNPASETNWKIVARHYLPGGWEKSYSTSTLTRDFKGYPIGSRFDTDAAEEKKPTGSEAPALVEETAI